MDDGDLKGWTSEKEVGSLVTMNGRCKAVLQGYVGGCKKSSSRIKSRS